MGLIPLILYVTLCVGIFGFLVSGLLTILQFNGFMSKTRIRFVKYLIFFAIFTVFLMAILVMMIVMNTK
jgi:hypothetical protein